MNIDEIFSDVTKKLDELDKEREEILKVSREMVRKCSIAIKSIHRSEFNTYEEKIREIKQNHKSLLKMVSNDPNNFGKYLKTPEQEYIEALSLFSILKNQELLDPKQLDVDPINYLLGLADTVGELRRYVLDKIRRDELDDLDEVLDKMEEIYSNLFALDYPKGLTKDLRRKTDVARSIIEKTRGDISLSIQLNKLNKNLKKQA